MRKYILYFLIASVSFLQAGINEDLLQGAMEGNTALVKRSIEQRAELETKNEEGETALILAAWYGSPEIVILLLENGANVNAQDKLGFTAIAKASSLGVGRHYEIVELLIQASANVNLKTKDGRSPFILAIINGHRELSNVLKRAGAKDEPYFTGEETNLELLAAAFNDGGNSNAFVLSLKKVLAGKPCNYACNPHQLNRKGKGEGVLVGGNLSLLVHSIGTVSDIDTKNKILFLEDIGEYLYHIDRMMMQLKRAGKLDQPAGIIFGSFNEMKDTAIPFGSDIYSILYDKLKQYNYPVCFDFPVGHSERNYALKHGIPHKLSVTSKKISLREINL